MLDIFLLPQCALCFFVRQSPASSLSLNSSISAESTLTSRCISVCSGSAGPGDTVCISAAYSLPILQADFDGQVNNGWMSSCDWHTKGEGLFCLWLTEHAPKRPWRGFILVQGLKPGHRAWGTPARSTVCWVLSSAWHFALDIFHGGILLQPKKSNR